MYDIRLKEKFKLFLSGPSRCWKTFFVGNVLENLLTFAREPPTFIVYIFKVWQHEYEEMKNVDIFLKEEEYSIDKIKSYATGHPILVIFDDMINSNSLSNIAPLFTVDGRHLKMSLIFLSQRAFVNDEYFRQISQNCDYFVLFKNPRNSSEIRTLAQQMTPGTLHLIDIYITATKEPFSYLFINLTQEAHPHTKFLSNLFQKDGIVNAFVEQ